MASAAEVTVPPNNSMALALSMSLLNHSSEKLATIVDPKAGTISTMVEDFKDRLGAAMIHAGATTSSLATALGVSYQAVRKVELGSSKSFTAINNAKAAKFLKVSGEWLSSGIGKMTDTTPQETALFTEETEGGYAVALLANAGSMGGGEQMHDEVVVGRLTLSPTWINRSLTNLTKPENLRFIHGYGDSMEPTFVDGDILLVDGGVRDVKVDGIFVLEANDRLYIKRVRQRMDASFEISSDNVTVKTVDVLDGSNPVKVLGRVVWVWNGRKL